MTALGSTIRGVAASAPGTLAMDASLYRRYRHDGGNTAFPAWESSGTPKVWYGLPFGAAVWAFGYVVLPLLGVYKPIWEYDTETLGEDLSAHLVFGTATAAAFCLLADGAVDK